MTNDKNSENTDNIGSGKVPSNDQRVDYLFECLKLAKQELLVRFESRQHWLKLQLLAQVVLLALSHGIQIAGVQSEQPMLDVLALSPAISVVLACLYFVDDSLISYIGSYLRAVTDAEARLRAGDWKILNWDSSKQVEAYVTSAVNVKYIADFTAFVLIPFGLFLLRITSLGPWNTWNMAQIVEILLNIAGLLLISYLVYQSLRRRKDVFLSSPEKILEAFTSPNQQA